MSCRCERSENKDHSLKTHNENWSPALQGTVNAGQTLTGLPPELRTVPLAIATQKPVTIRSLPPNTRDDRTLSLTTLLGSQRAVVSQSRGSQGRGKRQFHAHGAAYYDAPSPANLCFRAWSSSRAPNDLTGPGRVIPVALEIAVTHPTPATSK
jgi:hypothetical protein